MLERWTWAFGMGAVLLALSARAVAMVEVTQAAPMTGDRLQLDLKLQDRSVKQVTVKSRDEKAAPDEQRVKASGGHSQIVVSAAEPSVVFPSGAAEVKGPPKPLPAKEQSFEALLIEPGPQASGDALDALRQWVLVVRALNTPLRWDGEHAAYTTELIVGLQGAGASRGMSAELSKPIVVQLMTVGAKVAAAKLELSHGGVAGFKTTLISLPHHEATGTVTALTDLGERAYQVVAEPSLGALRLELGNDSIAGFGVGTTQLSAVRLAEDGREWFAPKALDVTLRLTGRGSLEAEKLHFGKEQARSASVEFRSAFLGESTVVVQATGVAPEKAVVRFGVPWSLFVAIVLGVGLGAGIRELRAKRRRGFHRELVVNVLSGLLLSVASLIGVATVVALPSTALLTEAGCFVVAAVAAYLGSDLVERLWPSSQKPAT